MKKILKLIGLAVVVLIALGVFKFFYDEAHYPAVAFAAHKVPVPRPPADRPPPNPTRNVYFGELHVHTSYSGDANLFGNENDERMAYRFAKGAEITLQSGLKQRLLAPLDFVAITDHAEGLGGLFQCGNRDSGTYWSLDCIGIRHRFLPLFPRLFRSIGQHGKQRGRYNNATCGENGALCAKAAYSVWQDVQNAANEAYEPGKFTSFIGFEFSPTLDQGGMLHRNVIFGTDTVPPTVFNAFDGFAEDLLRWLDASCKAPCEAITIPHNSNFSWGLMFGDRNSDGTPVTRENLQLRARYEKLVEIFQAKGGSECLTGVGNNDELCNLEELFPACKPGEDKLDDTGLHARRCVANNDLVRNVLRNGLLEAAQYGFNPRKFGIIASTDNHNSSPGDTQENTYKGHFVANDATPELRLGMSTTPATKSFHLSVAGINPGGLAGIWAGENTREALFAAMKRRETFGTSGTRIRVRLFGGFGFAHDLDRQPDMAKIAYATGVPMGGDLAGAKAGQAPSFVVQALRDPNSAPLQRIQIVKGWVDGSETREQVYDVVCSDGLSPDPRSHQCPDNNARVNLDDCSLPREKGAAQLSTTWRDPDFRATQDAFYYARVLEDPTCRYSTYDAKALGLPVPEGLPKTIQERAWTSPIWYSAKG